LRRAPREEAEPAWKALERRIGSGALTCSWDWTGTWLRHYGDVVPHCFALGVRGDELCGATLLTAGVGQRRGRFPLRTRHLGTAGAPPGTDVYVERNRLLAEEKDLPAFATALLEALRADRGWDELRLDGFAPPDADYLLAAEPRLRPRVQPCPTADLRGIREGKGDVIEALAPGPRRRVRRSLRGFGQVETEWAETSEAALAIFDELVKLHGARWRAAGMPGAFASRRLLAFHREIIARLVPRERAILFRVRADGRTIACLYSHVERGRVLFYQGGLERVDDGKLKPGLVGHALCMQACLERGLDVYDFLAGDHRYKRELSDDESKLVWATMPARRPRAMALEAASRGKRLARRTVSSGVRGDWRSLLSAERALPRGRRSSVVPGR
jgi:Acetyltransferase (GNAT) domain